MELLVLEFIVIVELTFVPVAVAFNVVVAFDD
jgi:hypothetical protein